MRSLKKRRSVSLLVVHLLAGLVASSGWQSAEVAAQNHASPALQDAATAATSSPSQVKKVTIHAAAEPDPALKYRFWPAPEYRTSDNPVPFISRAIILMLQATDDPADRQDFSEKFNAWTEMSLEELPREEMRTFISRYGGSALNELHRAENFFGLQYDLHMEELSAAEMVATLLPEFQEMRQLSRLLYLRIRLAIAEERWQDAVHDLRIGFRLSEVAAHSTDFLIGRLVGFAIAGIMMEATMEAIQQPGCPNLYWALAGLPADHLFETRDSIESESALISRLTSKSPELPEYPIGAIAARDQIRMLAEQATTTFSAASSGQLGAGFGASEIGARLLSGLYVVAMADESRELLATSTPWGDRAHQLSAPEAVLRATRLKFARVRDGWVKWNYLPDEVWQEYGEEQGSAAQIENSPTDFLANMVNLMIPAVNAARRAGLRTTQMRNFLISIEAIRMHAAQTGELPKVIDGLRPVPCWLDRVAGQPFGYQRTTSETATLTRAERYPGDEETVFQIELIKGNE